MSFFYLRIYFSIFQNGIVKVKELAIFFIYKMRKFPNFNNFENSEQLSSTLSVQVI